MSLAALVVQRTCKGPEICMAFWREKSEVGYNLERTLTLKKTIGYLFQHIVLGAETVLTAPNDVLY